MGEVAPSAAGCKAPDTPTLLNLPTLTHSWSSGRQPVLPFAATLRLLSFPPRHLFLRGREGGKRRVSGPKDQSTEWPRARAAEGPAGGLPFLEQPEQTKGTNVPFPCFAIGGSFSCPGPHPSTQPSIPLSHTTSSNSPGPSLFVLLNPHESLITDLNPDTKSMTNAV